MIALIDYGMANLRCVEQAFRAIGEEVTITSDPALVTAADRVILPGVGALGACMDNLRSRGLEVPVKAFITSGKPFLGICVGMQMLFEYGTEMGQQIGMGVLPGCVVGFEERGVSTKTCKLKVPHIGWNSLQFPNESHLFEGIEPGAFVYFVHSYFPQPADSALACAQTEYGLRFTSMVWNKNVFACQFHPEKSQSVGLKMLENFVKL